MHLLATDELARMEAASKEPTIGRRDRRRMLMHVLGMERRQRRHLPVVELRMRVAGGGVHVLVDQETTIGKRSVRVPLRGGIFDKAGRMMSVVAAMPQPAQ